MIARTPDGYNSTPIVLADFHASGHTIPSDNVVADANGNLFGTTNRGGAENSGTAFEITDSGFATTPTVVPILTNILWQNTSTGQASVWEMDSHTLIGGGPVTPNPGLAWEAVATGDFHGNGRSDILWENASTGKASIWEMDGNNVIGSGAVLPDPGIGLKAIGTGDFNGDGFSDILWQNTPTGQAAVWIMHGNTRVAGGFVLPNPGSA